MRFILTFLGILLLATSAQSGAWPRDAGTTFVALSFTAKADRTTMATSGFPEDNYSALYLEHGVTPRLTLGLDSGYAKDGTYAALAFARRPIASGAGPNVFAISAGLGVTNLGGQSDTVSMVGLHFGRGLATRLGGGWVALDTSARYRILQRNAVVKADLTLGLAVQPRTKLMLQFQAGQYPGSDAFLRVVPSVARKFGRNMHVELGLEVGAIGDRQIGLKLGTWLEF
jgi:hypothetical protein